MVIDEEEIPLPNANVEVKDANIGASTNFDGEFELEVEENSVLKISFIGFLTQEVSVEGGSELTIIMEESKGDALEEVVVVGYGEQKRKNVVGAVSTDTLAGMSSRPTGDVRDALQGAIPGLNIQHAQGGDPAQDTQFNIRGFNSINGGKPLVLVDGVEENIAYVNPADVESVTVLKDAESAAVYGARAAFGVILITTKSGKEGKVRVNYDFKYGWRENATRTDFISDPYLYNRTVDAAINGSLGSSYSGWNSQDFEIAKEVANGEREPFHEKQNDGTYKFYYNTDFYDVMFRKRRPMNEHNISVQGGSEKFNARLSGRIHEQVKIQNIQKPKTRRSNMRLVTTLKPVEWLDITGDFRFSTMSDMEYSGTKDGWEGVYTITAWRDLFPQYPATIDGQPVDVGRDGNGSVARLGALYPGNTFHSAKDENFTNTIRAKATPVDGLELNFDYTNKIERRDKTHRQAPFEYLQGNELREVTGGQDRLNEFRWKDKFQAINFFGSYDRSFNNHNLKLMLGYNEEVFSRNRINAEMEKFASREKANLNLGASMYDIQGQTQDWGVQGVFGRFNYDYKDKYLLELNARYDGSSRFPSGDRWGFFPSGAISWRLDKEDFWSGIKDALTSAKIRFSAGQLGNQSVGVDTFKSLLNFGQTNWKDANGNRLFYASAPAPLPETIGWETITTKNIGLDIGLFGNKLNGSFELYQKDTRDMYLPGQPVPAVFGASEPRRSFAGMRNRGWEVALDYATQFNVSGSKLSLNISANISNNVGEITKYDNPDKLLSDFYEGQRLGEIWGYKTDGRFKNDEEAMEFQNSFDDPESDLQQGYALQFNTVSNSEWNKLRGGDVKFIDLNGDGKLDKGEETVNNPGDLAQIGNAMPRFPFGFTIGTDWKGFDVSMRGQGIISQDWYPTGSHYWGTYHRPYATFIRKDLVEQAYVDENNLGKYPAIERGYDALNSDRELHLENDLYLENLGYLRIKNVTVGYTLPKDITKKLFMRKLRIYFSAENLATIRFHSLTNYIDPEDVSTGIDYNDPNRAASRNPADENAYPTSKTYTFGINATF